MYVVILIYCIYLGYLDFLEKVKVEGDFVIVGLYIDFVSNIFLIYNCDSWYLILI